MEISVLLLCLFVNGVSGVYTDEVNKVNVMLGDSVTLNTDVTDIHTSADLILWIYGPGNDRIAQINIGVNKISIYDDVLDGKFRHRLMLDGQTGSLIITNISTTDSGLYEVQMYRGNDITSKRFSIIVTAHLPVPIITSNCSQPSSSSSSSVLTCVFSVQCSVMNVSHVTLSWYNGSDLHSSISVSDLNIRLSLPLEVEYQDTNTYSCVLNNPITNHTTHLNIDEVCQPCLELSGAGKEKDPDSHLTVLIGVIVVVVLGVGAAVMIFCIYKRIKKTHQHGQTSGDEHLRLNCVSDAATVTDGAKNIKVKAGNSFILDAGVTDIQSLDLIQWKFGEAGETTNPFIPISRINKNNEETVNNYLIEKFGGRLNVDKQTGSITIEDSRITHTGFYKLEINSNTDRICKSFFVTVKSGSSICKCKHKFSKDLGHL